MHLLEDVWGLTGEHLRRPVLPIIYYPPDSAIPHG